MSRGWTAAAIAWCVAVAAVSGGRAEQAQPEGATLVVGAGCFWCVEAMFEAQPGVLDVVSGYAGGPEKDPTYKEVSAGTTGHAEVVRIRFDPSQTSLATLLELFWKTHDPTDPRGVWPDFGKQYRSIILYADDEQQRAAEASREQAQARLKRPIATELVALDRFYPAEEYHQDYMRRNPDDRYVREIGIPKLKKLGIDPP